MHYDQEGFIEAADGTRLFFGLSGQGPRTLILNDGVGCDGFVWRYLLPRLSQQYRLVHWHYRAHGRSGPSIDPDRLGIEDLARDLHRLFEHLQLPRVGLLGHSMGTQVALEFYRQFPSAVDSLVLICGSFGRITETFHGSKALAHLLPTLLEGARALPWAARALWARLPSNLALKLAQTSGEIDPERFRQEDFARYWEHASLMEPRVFLRMLELAGKHDAADLLPHIDVPSLVLAGEHDTFTPMNLAEHMAATIPAASFEVIEGASHAAPIEQPDRIAQAIEAFLTRTAH